MPGCHSYGSRCLLAAACSESLLTRMQSETWTVRAEVHRVAVHVQACMGLSSDHAGSGLGLLRPRAMVNVGQHASQVQAHGSHALTACMGAAQVIIFAREAAADHFSGPLELLLQTRALIIPDSEGSQNLDTMLDSPESPRRWAWPRLEPRLGHLRDRSLPGKLAGDLRMLSAAGSGDWYTEWQLGRCRTYAMVM